MSVENKETLKSYEDKLDEYIVGTPKEVRPEVKEWFGKALELLPENANILEIGCGFGRDAEYLEQFGHKVLRTDAARSFVDYMRVNGRDAQILNVLKEPIPSGFDMIFANAVFLHFLPHELVSVLKKACIAMDENSILAFTVKHGRGSEWSHAKIGAPRFFQYWKPYALSSVLTASGLDIVECYADKPGSWIYVVAKKNTSLSEKLKDVK